MSHFELFLDDDNEVKFDVTIEGVGGGSISSKLVFESNAGFEVGFEASKILSDEIQFVIPSLKKFMTEGSTPARLEVFIDDRRFVPLDLVVDLKKSVKVEAAIRTSRIQKSPMVSAVLNETKAAKPTSIVTSKRIQSPTTKNALDDLISEIEEK